MFVQKRDTSNVHLKLNSEEGIPNLWAPINQMISNYRRSEVLPIKLMCAKVLLYHHLTEFCLGRRLLHG